MNERPSARDAAIQLLIRTLQESHHRIWTGQVAPAEEHQRLQRQLTIARELNDPFSIATTYIMLSALWYVSGDLDASIVAGEQAIAESEGSLAAKVRGRAVTALVNNSTTYFDYGQPHKALSILGRALGMIETAPELRDTVDTFHILSTQGHYLLAVGRYEDAKGCFEKVLQQVDRATYLYAAWIAEANRGLSEFYRHTGNLERATELAKLGDEIAARQDYPALVFHSQCALAHVDETHAEAHYTAALAALEATTIPMLRAIPILHEARFHFQENQPTFCRRFAGLAEAILHPAHIYGLDDELVRLMGN